MIGGVRFPGPVERLRDPTLVGMPSALNAAEIVDALTPPSGRWRHVDVYPVLASTNATSVEQPRDWRVVVADHQESGRGRHQRRWESPMGTSVAMSLTVPLSPRPQEWGWVPLVTGLAVRDALAAVCGDVVEVALKWPNDVLLRRAGDSSREPRKVCGILCESAGESVVAGVGVNVALEQTDLPVPNATSLLLEGFSATDAREQVIVAVARAFGDRYDALLAGGPYVDGVRRQYRDACTSIGADVRIHLPGDQAVTGCAVDVDDEGRIVIETPDGGRVAYAAGDVVHLRRTDL